MLTKKMIVAWVIEGSKVLQICQCQHRGLSLEQPSSIKPTIDRSFKPYVLIAWYASFPSTGSHFMQTERDGLCCGQQDPQDSSSVPV